MATLTPPAVRSQALNPSSASTGSSSPVASGRGSISVRRSASASTISPNTHRTKSTAWEPNAPTQPPPRRRSNSQPWGRSGTRDPELRCVQCTWSGRPIAPSSTSSLIRTRTGWCRNSKLSRWTTFARSASCSSVSASRRSMAKGLSQRTLCPLASARRTSEAWTNGGECTETRSRSVRRHMRSTAPASRRHHLDHLATLERREHGGDDACPEPGADHADLHAPVFYSPEGGWAQRHVLRSADA